MQTATYQLKRQPQKCQGLGGMHCSCTCDQLHHIVLWKKRIRIEGPPTVAYVPIECAVCAKHMMGIGDLKCHWMIINWWLIYQCISCGRLWAPSPYTLLYSTDARFALLKCSFAGCPSSELQFPFFWICWALFLNLVSVKCILLAAGKWRIARIVCNWLCHSIQPKQFANLLNCKRPARFGSRKVKIYVFNW